MKPNAALQLIFAFFLGLLAVAFVGIGVNTFYPRPEYSESPGWLALDNAWTLGTSIILLVCATVLLAVSLLLPDAQAVISNGIMLGGVFTMLYAVIVVLEGETSVVRFAVVAAALALTIAVGYLKFARGRRTPVPVQEVQGDAELEGLGDLGARVAALEAKLDAVTRALRQ